MSIRCAIRCTMPTAIVILSLLALVGAVFLPRRASESDADFSALWNTAEAIKHYVGEHEHWPRDWQSLSSSLAIVDPLYHRVGSSAVQSRVDVNFAVDLKQAPNQDNWYLRLKRRSLPAEEKAANDWLRLLVADQTPSS